MTPQVTEIYIRPGELLLDVTGCGVIGTRTPTPQCDWRSFHGRHLIFALLALFLSFCGHSNVLLAEGKLKVGSVGGGVSVTLSGSASYSIPLQVAPGTAGTRPQLSLVYDSQLPAGALGAGWGIGGLSTISRGNRNLRTDNALSAVRLNDTDALFLDGQRLLVVASKGVGATRIMEYRKEIDDETEVIQRGDRDGIGTFVVRTKGGFRLEYGSTEDSRIRVADGRVLLLAQSLATDSAGNFIRFRYAQNGQGDYNVRTVEYTGNNRASPKLAPYASIEFSYSHYPRALEAFISGIHIIKDSRLEWIESRVKVAAGERIVARYELNYEERPSTTSRFVLSKVEMIGADGSFLPPTQFRYSDPIVGWTPTPQFNIPFAIAKKQSTTGAAYRLLDVNGDGRLDLLFTAKVDEQFTAFAYANRSTFWERAEAFSMQFPLAAANGSARVIADDINGDGASDLIELSSYQGTPARALLGSAAGWANSPAYALPSEFVSDASVPTQVVLGRFRGTKVPDLILQGKQAVGFLRNTGSGWVSDESLAPPVPLDAFSRAFDVDCDGTPELIGKLNGEKDGVWAVFGLKGGKWTPETRAEFQVPIPKGISAEAIVEVPGAPGVCSSLLIADGRFPDNRAFWSATTSGWRLQAKLTPTFDLTDSQGRRIGRQIADVDGDKKADVVIFTRTRPVAFLQHDSEWVTRSELLPPRAGSERNLLIGDISGDQIPDLLFVPETPTGSIEVFLGAGGSFNLNPSYSPPAGFARKDKQDRGLYIVDLDGDGLQDILFHRAVKDKPPIVGAYLNKAGTWLPFAPLVPPVPTAGDLIVGSPVQFIDVDNDGYVDLLFGYRHRGEPDGVGTTRRLFRNVAGPNGTRRWEEDKGDLVPPVVFADEDIGDMGVRFLDLNGDGRADILVSRQVNGQLIAQAYLNDGKAWIVSPAYSPPLPFVAQGNRKVGFPVPNKKEQGSSDGLYGFDRYAVDLFVEFVDVDGDRLPDLVARFFYPTPQDEVSAVYLNGGPGWTLVPKIAAPVPLDQPSRDSSITHLWSDVNNDGFVDLVVASADPAGSTATYLSTGTGWITNPAWRVPSEAIGSARGNPSFRLVDVNGDGFLDVVYSRQQTGTNALIRGLYVNNGTTWVKQDEAKAPNLPFSLEDGSDAGVRLIDVDGNGLLDVIRSYSDSEADEPTVQQAELNGARRSDLLTSVSQGIGLTTDIEYHTLLEPAPLLSGACEGRTFYERGSAGTYPIIAATPAMYAVRRVVASEFGIARSGVSYCYGDFRIDALAMRSLGIGWREAYVEYGGILTRTDLSRDAVSRGHVERERVFLRRVNQGKVTETPLTDTRSELTIQRVQSPAPSAATRYRVQVTRTSSETFELDGTRIGGQNEEFDYDQWGNAIRVTTTRSDGSGAALTNEYANDPSRWLLGRLLRSQLVKRGDNGLTETRIATFSYEPETGLLASETSNADTEKAVTAAYVRDIFGNVISTTTSAKLEKDRVENVKFDARGRFVVEEENALRHRLVRTWSDTHGQLLQVIEPNGNTTKLEYDAFGRLSSERSSTGVPTSVRWVLAAEVAEDLKAELSTPFAYASIEQVAQLPAVVVLYDGRGRMVRTIRRHSNGRLIFADVIYDPAGQPSRASLPYFAGTSPRFSYFSRDSLGRLTRSQTPDGAVTQLQYHAIATKGTSLVVTEPGVRQTVTESNLRGLPIRRSGPDGDVMTYTYDAGDRLSVIRGPTGAITRHFYDDVGHRVATEDPDLGRWEYRHDAFGQLVWQRDAKNQVTTLEYDTLRRLTRRIESDRTSYWDYDTAPHGVGKIASVRSSDGYREDYVYDQYGRQERRLVAIGTEQFSTSVEYDALGRLSSVSFPTSFAIRYEYAPEGGLRSIRDGQDGAVYWRAEDFDLSGRVTRERFGNGVVSSRTFDQITGRLRNAASKGAEGKGTPIADLGLEYDIAGNIKRRYDSVTKSDERFRYDRLGRLVSVTSEGNKPATLSYDAAGRFKYKSDLGTYSYGSGVPHHGVKEVKLLDGALKFEYDNNGNLIRQGETRFEFTADNRLKAANEGTHRWTRFDYAPSGERYRQIDQVPLIKTETIFVGGYERISESRGAAGENRVVRHRHYLANAAGVFAAVERSVYFPFSFGNTGKSYERQEVWYVHPDQIGSVSALTNSKGEVVARFQYDSWGSRNAMIRPSDQVFGEGTLQNSWTRAFTGHAQLNKNSLVHMKGRVYDTRVGQFLSPDLLATALSSTQALNRYAYVQGNPISWVDPTGYFRIPVLSDIVDAGGRVLTDIGKGIEHFAHEVGHWVEENWRVVVVVAVAVAITVVSYGTLSPIAQGMIAGAVIGGGTAALYGQPLDQVLFATIRGAIFGAVGAGVGIALEAGSWGSILAEGHLGGVQAASEGRDYWSGFGVAALSRGVAPNIKGVPTTALRVGTRAALGGTVAQLEGKKFANGALNGAFIQLYIDSNSCNWSEGFHGNAADLAGSAQTVVRTVTGYIGKIRALPLTIAGIVGGSVAVGISQAAWGTGSISWGSNNAVMFENIGPVGERSGSGLTLGNAILLSNTQGLDYVSTHNLYIHERAHTYQWEAYGYQSLLDYGRELATRGYYSHSFGVGNRYEEGAHRYEREGGGSWVPY